MFLPFLLLLPVGVLAGCRNSKGLKRGKEMSEQ